MKKTIAILAALSLIAVTSPTALASDDAGQDNAVVASGGCRDSNSAGNGGATGLTGAEEDIVTDGGEDRAGAGVSTSPSVTVIVPDVVGAAEAVVQLAEGILIEGQPVGGGGTNFCDDDPGFLEAAVTVQGSTTHVCFDGGSNLLKDCSDSSAGTPITV